MNPKVIGITCSLEECVRLAKASGFEGVDVGISEAASIVLDKGTNYIKDLFHNAGLRIGGWGWFDGIKRDEMAFREAIRLLPSQARVAAEIGASRVTNWVLPFSDELEFKRNFDLHVERYSAAASILRDHGIRLALEFVGPRTMRAGHKYEFISDMHQMLQLVDAIGAGNVGLLLDSWHWYTSHGTAEDLRVLTNDLVVYVHVNDAPSGVAIDKQIDDVRRLPGTTGVINIVEFLTVLHEMGYDGPVTPEPLSSSQRGASPCDVAAKLASEAMDGIWTQAGLA